MRWVKVEIPVRYVECDPMGVVHHSNYFSWFEVGRVQLATEAGLNLEKASRKLFMPVININCNYKSSAKFGETVIVETALVKPKKAYLHFEYRVYRKYGRKLLVKGSSEHAFTRTDGTLILKLPDDIKQKIDIFLGGVS
ncbi:acyl-CoA thioesterase [Bacillus sp. CH30_1T]|uniref:acyl-CoA thioesterase n=1 Tax=Bacillus sp. CH30_1T TaxID=2604836 RepID=UPI0011EF3842|nr:acyl-CoA thioesterase [Bacillus sp. CH30_1T]KAA0560854.1 acyl-CoA thioesterase [Bacillus sp. CH30_1T]